MSALVKALREDQDRIAELEHQRDELLEALRPIGRMKVFPDDATNRMTLVAAIASARAAIASVEKPGGGDDPR